MLLRCCLIHLAINILRHILYIVCLCSGLGLGRFISYLCDLLFIFSLIFIVINHITSFKQMYLFFVHFLEYFILFLDEDDNTDLDSKKFSDSKSSASGCCLAFARFFCQYQPDVAYKKSVYSTKKIM